MVTVFSLGDTIGRASGGYLKIFGPKTIIIFTLSRSVFIVTSILIQLAISPAWLFQSDWFRITNMFLLSLTNGYNTAALLQIGPHVVDIVDKERVGLLLNNHFAIGSCIGTVAAAFGMSHISSPLKY